MAKSVWIPGYLHQQLGQLGGTFDETSNPKGCLHTTEGRTLVGAEAAYKDYPPHIGYDPVTRAKHQYVPLNRHSYAFRGAESDDEYVIQVEIVGFANTTHWWSTAIYSNIAKDVFAPLEDLVGIPRKSLKFYGEDAGFVLASKDSPIRLSPGSLRNYTGWLGHQHIPAPDTHWDPGKFQIQKVFNAQVPVDEKTPVDYGDNGMIEYVRGDSMDTDPNGIPWGYRVFWIDWDNLQSEWIRDPQDPGLALWKATGHQVKVVKQEILDRFNQMVQSKTNTQ